jgi:Tfp pilus assembly protein FimT
MVEMMMAMVVAVVTAGIAIPTTTNAIAESHLRGAASSFASLAQQGRFAAVQKNATYTLRFNLSSGHGAYVDLDDDSSYDFGEPMVQFGGNVDQVAAPAGSNPSKLDSVGGPLGWTAASGSVSFNPRGLTCDITATPCGTNVNYVFYFRDTRPLGSQGWAAVSVSAAGRIKVWKWNGTQWKG